MGGDSEPPFLYTPTHRPIAYPYSDFNPKAVTQAEHEKAKRRSQAASEHKRNGPLIDFNKHPDSYMIVSGSQPNFKPLPKGTKKTVVVVRWVQFAHRIINEIAALGMLTCVIMIKGMQGAQRWLVTIPPAFDALIALYGIYHLVRPARARTPGSSSSYHFFALIIDCGLIPLYVVTALFANNNYVEPVKTDGRWTSFFDDSTTNLLLRVAFTGAIAVSALHLGCAGIDLYLLIIFRKISNLPPDMNPLEDNLTSRKSFKGHKYKDSNATSFSTSTINVLDEKRAAYLSGSTLNVDNQSRTSLYKDPDMKQVEFRNSRTNDDFVYSPHNPNSARLSKQRYDEAQSMYQQNDSARNSRYTFDKQSYAGSISPSKNGTTFDLLEVPPPSSPARDRTGRPKSYVSNPSDRSDSPARYHRNAKSVSTLNLPDAAQPQVAVEKQQKEGLLKNSNWYSFDDDEHESDLGVPSPTRDHSPYCDSPPVPRPAPERHDSFEPTRNALKPLGMHPPSPSTRAQFVSGRNDNSETQRAQPATLRPDTLTSAARPESHQLQVAKMYQAQHFQRERERKQIKLKHDRHDSFEPVVQTLRDAQRKPLLTRDPPTPPRINEQMALIRNQSPEPEDDDPNRLGVQRSDTTATASSSVYSESAPSLVSSSELSRGVGTPKGKYYGDLNAAMAAVRGKSPTAHPTRGSPYALSGIPATARRSPSPSPPRRNPARVVSRTGIDITDAASSGARRREVSGKVAEEGRGGRW